ncbi:MAG: alpha-amylase family glycosyl hydrolase, partial [Rectinemataceae bacterium]|nr:alpha-amylase family glycosyl hydrolase [Rectinemataceae bacterium]
YLASRTMADRINRTPSVSSLAGSTVSAGRLNAMALVDEILHDIARIYREQVAPGAFSTALGDVETALGAERLESLLLAFTAAFPPLAVQSGTMTSSTWLTGSTISGISNRELAIEELILLHLANENTAFSPFRFLFDNGVVQESGAGQADAKSVKTAKTVPGSLAADPAYARTFETLEKSFKNLPAFGPDREDLLSLLRAPARASPDSITGQLEFMRRKWGFVAEFRNLRLLGALDLINEEEMPRFPPGPGPTRAYEYRSSEPEYERYSSDLQWMPSVVMLAKSTLVWLHQLSVHYARPITRLDQIPDEELDTIASRGFTVLWLIGLWERSTASEQIKKYCGNPEAAASAYSLFDYEIAHEIGGWDALGNLKDRCVARGIRLGADMVPNHTGLDSAWIRERPELFVSTRTCPYPGYSWNGPDLSRDSRIGLWLEDHYYDRSDAAVVFKRLDRRTGRVDYIYHGNDGTGMAWNDTAQIDFLNPAARAAVQERILHVAKNFPVIRFDAAMVLAKRHIKRLWYPEPGRGGDVPSRSGHAMSAEAFDEAMPEEFWREVVDMCAKEAPDTLLLAEAFWMMEGYFVRTLGMHRVYNSAFMNMLKREENAKYRETIRNTQEFDREILKRFVNFMNNPDEEPAIEQFGAGDKYFGVCTLMATMPGLPMFGHGQVEGFCEKYGMEYRRSYRDEKPDRIIVERHAREIFPLLKRRGLYAGVDNFYLFDFCDSGGLVNENVFAYTNGTGDSLPRQGADMTFRYPGNENATGASGAGGAAAGRGHRSLVLYNNTYGRASGSIRVSCPFAVKLDSGEKRQDTVSLAQALCLPATRGDFLAMRELKTGLWYLRRCTDLSENGLSFDLDGFACRVFTDLHIIADSERGICASVCDALNGQGTRDLGAALADARRPGLYSAFGALVREGIAAVRERLDTDSAGGLQGDGYGEAPPSRVEALRKLAEVFFAELRDSVAREKTDLSGVVSADILSVITKVRSPDRASADARAAAGLLAGLSAIHRDDEAIPARMEIHCLAGEAAAARREAASVVYGILQAARIALGLSAESGAGISNKDFARAIAHFGFSRKAHELLAAICPSETGGAAVFDTLAWVVAFAGRPESHNPAAAPAAFARAAMTASARVWTPAARALELALWAEGDPEAARCMGVNVWQGVEYFSKELFGEALRCGIELSGIETEVRNGAINSGAAAREVDTMTATVAKILVEAEMSSGYRTSRLILLLEAQAAKAGTGS